MNSNQYGLPLPLEFNLQVDLHREDICEALEIIMAAARYPELVEEVEKWRDW